MIPSSPSKALSLIQSIAFTDDDSEDRHHLLERLHRIWGIAGFWADQARDNEREAS